MLGLRYFRNVALDLWVGQASEFWTDLFVLPRGKESELLGASSLLCHLPDAGYATFSDLTEVWSLVEKRGYRHVGFLVQNQDKLVIEAQILQIQAGLSELKSMPNKMRITFVIADLATHKLYKEILFKIYPEGVI